MRYHATDFTLFYPQWLHLTIFHVSLSMVQPQWLHLTIFLVFFSMTSSNQFSRVSLDGAATWRILATKVDVAWVWIGEIKANSTTWRDAKPSMVACVFCQNNTGSFHLVIVVSHCCLDSFCHRCLPSFCHLFFLSLFINSCHHFLPNDPNHCHLKVGLDSCVFQQQSLSFSRR